MKPRKIVEKVPNEQLMADLERYRQEALRLGATDARVVSSEDVIIDERVTLKCVYPKCPSYGTNANCPPYAIAPREMREVVRRYRYAIFFTIEARPEIVLGVDAQGMQKMRRMIPEIVSKLEAAAFFDGYYLATGFGAGSCKALFCPEDECTVTKLGQPCRADLKARSAMEAVGMDAFLMATKMGWDIYPCGRSTNPEDVPLGRRVGLVLIY